MPILRPQRYDMQNQPPEKIWKGSKYLETEEHPTKKMNGLSKKLKRKLKSTWNPMKMITPKPKTSGKIGRAHV